MSIPIQCEFAEMVDIGALKPNPLNRNIHLPTQIDHLRKLIEYQGFRHPIIVSKNSGYVVAGHGRLEAAKRLGMKTVPVDYQEFANSDAEYAFLVSDNAVARQASLDLAAINFDLKDLGPDFNLDMLGIMDFKLDMIEKLEPQCDEDETPSAPVEPKSKLGDIYELGPHRVMCGDSTSIDAVETLMNGQNADMVFTDPPYGVKEKTNRKSSGRGCLAQNQDFSPVIGDDSTETAIDAYHLCESLKIPSLIFWGANYYAHSLPEVSSWIIWDKRGGVKSDDNADCELAWCNNKKPARIFTHLWKGAIRASEKSEKKVHPTQKPIALAEWCFENYGEPRTVLDLFGGSGSTLIAAAKTNRKAYLMELDPKYVDVIVSRYVKYSGNSKIKLNGEEIEWTL